MSLTSDHLERFLQRLGEMERRQQIQALKENQPIFPVLTPPITDPLTQLPNRKAIIRLAEFELRYRQSAPLALIVFDVDDLKVVNGRFLLPGGDAVLRQLADVLANTLRSDEFVGRFGGDRFLVVAADTDREQAMVLADQIHASVKQTSFIYKEDVIAITVSLGVAVAEAGMASQPTNIDIACAEGGVSDELRPFILSASDEMEQAKRRRRASKNGAR